MNVRSFVVVTTNEIPGARIVQVFGVVQGIVVRAVPIVERVSGFVSGLSGGSLRQFEDVCEDARQEAYSRMKDMARDKGANAIVGMRFDAVEVGKSMSEVLAYGTAVKVEWPADD